MALVACEVEGCRAKVVVGQNTRCSHHRPRPPRGEEKRSETAEMAAARARRRRRQRAAAGMLWT